MAKTSFSDMLINPRLNLESTEPVSQKSDSRRPSRAVTVLTILLVAALGFGAGSAFHSRQLSRQQSVGAQAIEGQLAVVSQSLKLIDERLDAGGDQIASLQSQLQVTMQRVGVTQKELKIAQALAERLKEEQKRNVEGLNRELAQKSNPEQVATLKKESGEKFKGVNEEISTVKRR